MKTLTTWMLLICAVSLAGCSTTGSALEGSGYKKLTPNAATRRVITSEDIEFAKAVVAHNRQCEKDKGCQK